MAQNIFSRILFLARANINDAIDKAQNPEAMAKQVIRDLNSAMVDGQTELASVIADVAQAQHALDAKNAEVADWTKKAQLAVTKGRDDMAREALTNKNAAAALVPTLQAAYDSQAQAEQKLKDALATLSSQRALADSKLQSIQAKLAAAHTYGHVAAAEQAIGTGRAFDEHSLTHWDEAAQHQLDEAQARAQIFGDKPENKWEALQTNTDIEDELARMKAAVAPKS